MLSPQLNITTAGVLESFGDLDYTDTGTFIITMRDYTGVPRLKIGVSSKYLMHSFPQ